MPRIIQSGWLRGHHIRTARKAYRCAGVHGPWPDQTRCQTIIQPGDIYAEGEPDIDYAGGFGFKRLCLDCAGPEAKAAAEHMPMVA